MSGWTRRNSSRARVPPFFTPMMSACGSFLLPSPSGLSLPANLGDTFLDATRSGDSSGGSASTRPSDPTGSVHSYTSLLVLCEPRSCRSPRLEDALTGELVPQRSVRQCRRKREVSREHSMTAALLETPRFGGSSLPTRLKAIPVPGGSVQEPQPCWANMIGSPRHEENRGVSVDPQRAGPWVPPLSPPGGRRRRRRRGGGDTCRALRWARSQVRLLGRSQVKQLGPRPGSPCAGCPDAPAARGYSCKLVSHVKVAWRTPPRPIRWRGEHTGANDSPGGRGDDAQRHLSQIGANVHVPDNKDGNNCVFTSVLFLINAFDLYLPDIFNYQSKVLHSTNKRI